MSQAFSFYRENGKAVLTVFAWTVASALIALALDFVELINVPTQYAFIIPLVNTVLYALKEFVTTQKR